MVHKLSQDIVNRSKKMGQEKVSAIIREILQNNGKKSFGKQMKIWNSSTNILTKCFTNILS